MRAGTGRLRAEIQVEMGGQRRTGRGKESAGGGERLRRSADGERHYRLGQNLQKSRGDDGAMNGGLLPRGRLSISLLYGH